MSNVKKRPLRQLSRWLGRLLLSLLLLLGLLLVASALYNRTLPTASATPDRLSEAEKGRLAEFWQLREQLGATVWPGWETLPSPIIVYNESYVFLLGYPDAPPDGWQTVPRGQQRGGAWQPAPDDNLNGQPYYRQPLPANGETPQAFVVRVGDRWVSSMQTMEWAEISFANQLRADLPGFLTAVFPTPLVTNLFIRGSDGYISLLVHEAFHAYQGELAPAKVMAAETAVAQQEPLYPQNDTLQANWQTELDLLTAALQPNADAASLARQFLAQRQQRRQQANLSPDLIAYEQQREWLEGLARYTELELWRQAAQTDSYAPLPDLLTDPKFSGYATFDRRWQQEIDQIGRMADAGDGRFYYTGMAQAVLLDQLLPGWKGQALAEGVWLEGLLETAVMP
jgi:hypothetical protein